VAAAKAREAISENMAASMKWRQWRNGGIAMKAAKSVEKRRSKAAWRNERKWRNGGNISAAALKSVSGINNVKSSSKIMAAIMRQMAA